MTGPSEERVTQADRLRARLILSRGDVRESDLAAHLARHRHAATAPLLDLIEGALREWEAVCDGGDPDPFFAAMDALTAALAQHRTNGDG